MKIVFDKQYGKLSYMQRAAYRKHNVTPDEHAQLVRSYGEHNHWNCEYAVRGFVNSEGTFDFRAWYTWWCKDNPLPDHYR